MAKEAPRIHRLPQRFDYALIPAPIDVTLPASEKSSLPSIIVTPSSPGPQLSSYSSPFYIAFLAPPPKASIRERIGALATPFQFNARAVVLILVLLFIVFFHILIHRLVAFPDHRDFSMTTMASTLGGEEHSVESSFAQWFYFRPLWGDLPPDDKRDFIITAMAG